VPYEDGRLGARSGTLAGNNVPQQTGLRPLGLDSGRDGLIYVPTGYAPDNPPRLVLLLHGAGGNAQGGIGLLQSRADAANLLLLAPDSRASTWDVILGAYGPDVAFIDRALAQTFSLYAIEPSRLAIGGFSDGASYALSLGLTNGDLFTHIIAFSPGFMAPARLQDRPRVFISHGTHDSVLPIDLCSRRLVPELKLSDYDVDYREFDGPHTVPPEISRGAVAWFTT
jgi:phospholipase/carboxylesterase